jgi:hypothetical protein
MRRTGLYCSLRVVAGLYSAGELIARQRVKHSGAEIDGVKTLIFPVVLGKVNAKPGHRAAYPPRR